MSAESLDVARRGVPRTASMDALRRLLPRALARREDRALAERLRRADLQVTPGTYEGLRALAAAGGGVATALVSGAALAFAGASAWPAWALAVGGVTALAALGAFPFVLTTRISNRKAALDRELPYALSEMSVLASVGVSPIALVRRMAARPHDPAVTAEFRRVVAMTDLQGRDVVTALTETARGSPSEALRETLWDLANLVHQGGDLDAYLRAQSDRVLEAKRATQRGFVAQLGTYADVYITLVLVSVMFLGIGAFLIDAFRMTAGGLDAEGLLLLLTYGLLPLTVLVVGILLSTAYARHEA